MPGPELNAESTMQDTIAEGGRSWQTHTFQQTIVQPPQPATRKMAATVPEGYYGGMQMTVNTPHGQMRVTIPPGYGPGSSFTFNVPVQGGGGFHY